MSIGFKLPQITWASGSANTLVFARPIDNWAAYSKPREGSQTVQSLSGVEDAWITGTDYVLEGDVKFIPQSGSSAATGWNDATTGWMAFLEWARAKNTFNWYPDKTNLSVSYESYLVEPWNSAPITNEDTTRTLRLVIRNSEEPYTDY